MQNAVIEKFLKPSSVAIIGISARSSGTYRAGGRAVLDHLRGYGFAGDIWPIHPTAEAIDDVLAYPSVEALPATPDCVVVAVSSEAVLDVVEQCGNAGARQILLLSGGFGELGAEGAALERALLHTARSHGISLVGPNSTGLVNVRDKVALSMTSVLTGSQPLAEGGLAVIAQSGAIASSLVERARNAGVGLSHLISIGNQIDLTAGDFLRYIATQAHVTSAALYLESVRNRDTLEVGLEAMRRTGKAVVALLGGDTPLGEAAASSHTGKMLGRGALERSLLQARGVTLVDDLDSLWLIGDALGRQSYRSGLGRWAVVTFSGGMGVLTIDSLAGSGATLAQFSPSTRDHLQELLPAYVGTRNPLDVGPGAMPDHFEALLRAVASDDGVDGVCIPMPMGAQGWQRPIVDAILGVQALGKPILVSWYGGDAVLGHIRELQRHGIPTVESPHDLGRLVRAMASGAASASRPEPTPGSRDPSDGAPGSPAARSIGGFTALEALRQGGLDVAPMHCCNDTPEVMAAARDIGYPVVVKSADEQTAHRLDLGLVKVDLRDERELTVALGELARAAAGRDPDGSPYPLLVQEFAPKGTEVLLVTRYADDLGWWGVVGLGGWAVEIARDIAYVPLPCSRADLTQAISQTRTARLWFGYRGHEALDLDWVVRSLNQLVAIAQEQKWFEIEVNPAIVSGHGGWCVDALAGSISDTAIDDGSLERG